MKKTYEIALVVISCLAMNGIIFWMLCKWVMA